MKCKDCKYFHSETASHRICCACTGDPDEAYERVFNPRSGRRPWQE